MTPSGSIRIWWDSSVDAYRMATPYNKGFVDSLKLLIPVSDRAWDESARIWTVTERFLGPVQTLAEKHFGGKATVVTKAQSQTASQPPAVSRAKTDDVVLEFFKLLPYEAAQRAYRAAATTLHPDHGGSMEKMAKLNAAWQRLESELFGK